MITPKPWTVIKLNKANLRIQANEEIICELESDYNAKLIAKAPDLLALLIKARGQFIHSIHKDEYLELIDDIS